jgi:sec-independent protein translocase protein TatA
LIFILIFFGSKSIPSLARTAGRTIRQVREASNEIQNEIRKSGDDMKKDLNLKGIIEETTEDIKRPLDQYAADLEDAVKYQPPRRPRTNPQMGHGPSVISSQSEEKEKSTESTSSDTPKTESDSEKGTEKN